MRRHLVTIFLASIAGGCGGESYPETYAVTGTVTLKGKPIEGADVVLVPSDPAGRSAGGSTDARGNFAVKTYFDPQNVNDGAVSGDYSITVSKRGKSQAPEGLKPEEEMAWIMKHGLPKSEVPAKYNDPSRSGLKVTVGDESPEPLKLDLSG